jgi:regulator of PEP synthase PpsR (kinase-PPPase family)
MSSNSIKPIIFTVSDGTGETAVSIVRAIKVQFDDTEIQVEKFNKIRKREFLEDILLSAKDKNAIIVATVVDHELRVFLISRSLQLGIRVIDVLFPLLETLSEQLGKRPASIPGRLRQLDKDYFRRISAIEYTVRHDDGILNNELKDADIVLVGVSRTSKTPLSMYLGHKGYKVANIPIVPGINPPKELFEIDQNKIISLIIDPSRLAEIRSARMSFLGNENSGDYADVNKIFEELEWSRALFKKNRRWPVIDVTGKALEESAVEIEKIILDRFPNLEEKI